VDFYGHGTYRGSRRLGKGIQEAVIFLLLDMHGLLDCLDRTFAEWQDIMSGLFLWVHTAFAIDSQRRVSIMKDHPIIIGVFTCMSVFGIDID
jgi:hypothetical protein